MAKIAIIGSGFSGLSAACYLSAAGHEVEVFEKNATIGGRARQIVTEQGYVFDMGPSWYWMPEVFEQFFKDFGVNIKEVYRLELLDPAFTMVFSKNDVINIPSGFSELCNLFDSIEKGSAARLIEFMKGAQLKYETGMRQMATKPGLSLMEFADWQLLKNTLKLQVFSSFSKHIRKYFNHPKLIAIMEFPVLFLGGMPQQMPAMYSLMNYAGLKLGTWYPHGGFGKVIEAMKNIALQKGAIIRVNSKVDSIVISDDRVKGIIVNGEERAFDAVISGADYAHTENDLLPQKYRNYQSSYWNKKTFAPSCLIYYLGINKKLKLNHHTLFFEHDLFAHSVEIYKKKQWPEKPLFYVCCPSQTDATVAPKGHENLFLLMPVATGLEDTEATREKYFENMLGRLENHTKTDIRSHIDYKNSYCVRDFILDYNSYKGNAYGLANTLKQTANLKPKIKNKKVANLYYSGQLTVPGPGVPPSLISGKIAAQKLMKHLKSERYEIAL